MDAQFVDGDVVHLKTGGPKMTVERGGPVVRCVWFEKVDQPGEELWQGPFRAEYPASTLVKTEA